ncbi:hypothetical protein DM860_003615 [Cuscuta australis]|uniref:CRIB domain-containing protein n=1 Tax=Cuscuta australis TaxID=267555 RepID=A0A328DHF2_9ASTE|nr:hypothetical protein DM860_003615 [Cuscuta australis]
MEAMMKGTFKAGFKYISNIFVVKEDDIEIGFPTDVKHVAHIGWDGQSAGSAPTWMKEFKSGPDFTSSSIGNVGRKPSSPDFCKDDSTSSRDISVGPAIPTRKQRRKKSRAISSSGSSFSSSASRAQPKSKAKLVAEEGDDRPKPSDIHIV